MPVEIEKAKKLAKEELIKKIPCVVGVSAHHSKPVIRIYVEKLDPSVLKELPQVFLGYQVQVIEVGRVEALIDRKLRYRPLFPGISIGSELVTAGTLSQVCVDNKTGEYCLLSNRHVFWGDRGTAILQPGPFDLGKAPEDVVGYITRYEEIKYEDNIIDAAICSLEVEATNKDPELGQPARIGEVNEGDKVYKVGRTTGFTSAKVLDTAATLKVYGYSNVGEAIFDDVIITEAFSAGGDSITGDARMYFIENGKLRYGTVYDVYSSFRKGNDVRVLSVKRRTPYSGKTYPSIKTGEVVFEKIVDAIYHGVKPVWRITFHNGKQVEITEDHSLFTSKGYSRAFIPVTLNELDRVVSIDEYNFDGVDCGLDEDMLTFLGLWLGDGSYIKKDGHIGGVSISTGNEKDIVAFLKEFTKRFKRKFKVRYLVSEFRKNPSLLKLPYKKIAERYDVDTTTIWRAKKMVKNGIDISEDEIETKVLCYKNRGDYRIYSKELGELVFSIFGDVKSYNKRVPEFIMTAKRNQIAAFLRGYFSADGSIHFHKDKVAITCASVNRELLVDIQELLARFGIKSNIDSGYIPTKLSKRRQYKLRIEGRLNVLKFLEEIGFIKYKKRVKEYYEIAKKQNALRKYYSPFSIRGIRSIEFIGNKPVFDFKVNPTESFVANGILCHNSGSPVLNEKGELVGLVFAGSEKITVICKAKHVVNRLNITPIYGAPFVRAGVGLPILAMAAIPVASYYFAKGGRI